MMGPADLCAAEGAPLQSHAHGSHYRTCPRCSHLRSRANRKRACLRVEIDGRGVRFCCFHCGWFTARFYDEGNGNGKTLPFRNARQMARGRAQDPLRAGGGDGRRVEGHVHRVEYQRGGTVLFRKIRVEGNGAKSFFIEPKGAELCLWNEDAIREPQPGAKLIITEGELDALSFLAIGEGHVASVPNGAAGRPGQGNIDPVDDRQFAYLWDGARLKSGFDRFDHIILATDVDRPGTILRDELSIRLGPQRCWFVTYPPGCKDANEVLVRHGRDALLSVLAGAKPMVPNRLVRFSEIPPEVGHGYSAGWHELDRHLMIWIGLLIVVTGTPGHGKSQLTTALGANLARIHGLRGAILQFEDNPERNRTDLIAYARAWKGNPTHGIDCEPAEWVDRMFHTIAPTISVDDEDYTLDWVSSAIEEAATRHGCKWVIIDPWNEIEHLWGVSETETAYTVKALKHLKTLARKFKITLFLVTHPTKAASQNKTIVDMTLSDIAGSYAWRAKADIGIVVHRDDPTAPVTHIKIDKSKDHSRYGRPGIVRMEFVPTQATYRFLRHGI